MARRSNGNFNFVKFRGELGKSERFWENGDNLVPRRTSTDKKRFFSVSLIINFDKSESTSVSKLLLNPGERTKSILIFFWENFLSIPENEEKVNRLKPGMNVDVFGFLNGDTRNLMTVTKIEIIDSSKRSYDNDYDDEGELFL